MQKNKSAPAAPVPAAPVPVPAAPAPAPVPAAPGQAYLGQKGYTLYKNQLAIKELAALKDELLVKPYLPKSPVQPPGFPIYKESPNKIYLPRYFGLEKYGLPPKETMQIPGGDDAPGLHFAGELRDYQTNIVQVYLTHVRKNVGLGGGGLLEIPCGRGKTVIALKIIAELKKKTLVIVHKGFLLNQWEERIQQFLPGARVGKIQGQILDLDDKDIVIGMLQSLSQKDYPADLFQCFGLCIVDECHHISSEVFSRSLQKVLTYYALGLSATMVRKDGLTKVFKMFLGPIVYSEKRESGDPVLIKAVQFTTRDPVFNKMEYDYRGNPAYSTMISKLCAYSRRSEFILQMVKTELQIAPDQQIMILAHNKNILTYLHDAIKSRQLAPTVGYYVGGMKEADLKTTETCQIIIATYAMAAEALDIKTLTTLILATPRTDVVQAVGRILRVKHARPLVIDIVDTHDVFEQQWQKRRKFYISNKYQVLYTNSDKYILRGHPPAQQAVSPAYSRGHPPAQQQADLEGSDGAMEGSDGAMEGSDGAMEGSTIWETLFAPGDKEKEAACKKQLKITELNSKMKGKCLINLALK